MRAENGNEGMGGGVFLSPNVTFYSFLSFFWVTLLLSFSFFTINTNPPLKRDGYALTIFNSCFCSNGYICLLLLHKLSCLDGSNIYPVQN